jgi:hypothetical protein
MGKLDLCVRALLDAPEHEGRPLSTIDWLKLAVLAGCPGSLQRTPSSEIQASQIIIRHENRKPEKSHGRRQDTGEIARGRQVNIQAQSLDTTIHSFIHSCRLQHQKQSRLGLALQSVESQG